MASRSLGTLTLDLIAKVGGFVAGMDAAERRSEKWRKEVEKNAAKVGAAIGAATAAGITALAALTVSTVRNANEIANLASVANASTTEFQKYAAGAKLVGIEQEKLADIFKDVNDKVGDFLNTGGGALADFFENVAPKIGVTADQFRNLSGPQALGLYVSSLEKAKVSQSDMTFYLEAIASDATALLPLLRNNAEGFKTFGDAAKAAGAILDEKTIKSASELQAATWLVEQSTTGLKNQLTSALIPVLSDFATKLLDVSEDGTSMVAVGEFLVTTLKLVAGAAVATVGAFQLVGKSIAGAAAVASSAFEGITWLEIASGPAGWAKRFVQNLDGVKASTSVFAEDMVGSGKKIVEVLEFIGNAGTGDVNGRVKELAKLLDDLRKKNKTGTFEAPGKEVEAAAKRRQQAVTSLISSLQLEAATVGMTADEQKLYRLELDGATASQLAQAKAAIETVESFKKQQKAQEDYKKLIQDLRTDEERLLDTTKERLAVLDAMQGLSDEERNRVASRIVSDSFSAPPSFDGADAVVAGPQGELDKIDKAEEELEKWYQSQLDLLNANREAKAELTAQWDEQELKLKQEHEEALAAIERSRQQVTLSANEQFFGNLSGLAKSFFGEQSGLYKAAFVAEKSYAIAKTLLNAPKTASDAYAAMAGIPVIGPALGIAAAAAAVTAQLAQVAAVKNVNLSGQAHDGIMSVPEDGTWNLKKGERVTTAETSAKLDRTLDDVRRNQASAGAPTINLIEDRSRAGQVNTRRQDDQYIIDVVVADLFGDGRSSKAIGSSFGIRRSGT
ncbi:phage tail tape measure protein [Pseudomonas aeruginosa]|uniref:lambda family phage tail tape measure protein n=1 Tax=Pseudomonas aeruginosa TaxID=287 RepID=UPI0005A99AAD|nr:lambda family phage tail tape measure protein [Pseudomonas aeruginosa]QMX84188.1 phage tail tape measure protein [Pseudomonas aeruginosa]RPP76731.1 phage tail tape measure protein [Pseudomonas aeruginosa]UEG09918.1 phage tail tape measure protein [Pseudomonas aeruginosa]HCD9749524.1 phage tail tape measure protein [Pseudomonas aeruginosa]HCE3961808.1 phage tail tape measure protein [Pseudomonas aeruginosa]